MLLCNAVVIWGIFRKVMSMNVNKEVSYEDDIK